VNIALCAEGYRLYVIAHRSRVIVDGAAQMEARPAERPAMFQAAREHPGMDGWKAYCAHLSACPVCKSAWQGAFKGETDD
jgi:hypothetical protein